MYACHLPKKGSDQHFYHQNLIKSYSFKYYLQLLHTMRCKKWKKNRSLTYWRKKCRKKFDPWRKLCTQMIIYLQKILLTISRSVLKEGCCLNDKKAQQFQRWEHFGNSERVVRILTFLKSILRGREWVGKGWRSWVVEGGGQRLKFAEKDRCFSRFKPVTLRKVLSRNYAITSIGWT